MSDSSFTGRKVGRYRLVAELGRGSMAAVFRAEDESLKRDVVVKIVHSDKARQPAFRERFMQESRNAARLMHPGIVQVYDIGEEDDLLFTVSEYVPGPNLAGMLEIMNLRQQLAPISEVLALVGELATTVAYAHSRSVLHLRLKPSKVHVRPQPGADPPFYPLLADFGLAGLLEGDGATQKFSAETLDYLSPEQLAGETGDLRSDLYNLGILLFELLTGQRPFRATNPVEALHAREEGDAPDPHALRRDVPAEVSAIVARAMAVKSAARYKDAGELADALRKARQTPFRTTVAAVSLASSHPELARIARESERTEPMPAMGAAAQLVTEEPAQTESYGDDQLIIQFPDLTTHFFPITKVPFTIGSDSRRNEVVLPFDDIAPRHTRVDFDGVDYYVDDLGSSGGTYLATAQLLPGLPERWLPETPMLIGKCRILMGKSSAKAGMSAMTSTMILGAAAAGAGAGAPNEVAIRLPGRKLSVRPGEELVLPLTILNQSRLVDHFGLGVVGIPAAWVSLAQEAHMFPGDQRELTLVLRPPREAASRAGSFPIDIQVASRAMSRVVGSTTVDLVVEPFFQWRLALQPQRTKGTAQGRFTVQIVNEGNSYLHLELSAVDREGSCRFEFEPRAVAAGPGESCDVALTVSHLYSSPAEVEHTFTFTVTAGGDEQEKQVSGDWVHTPPAFDVQIEPQQQRSFAQATYAVVITNPERVAPHQAEDTEAVAAEGITVDLSASAPQAGCDFDFDPQELTILPGDSRQAILRVTPVNVLPEGAEQVHEFTVRAALRDSGVRQQASATWVQISPHFSLSLENVRNSGSVSGEFALTVVNNSEAVLEMALAATDKAQKCMFAFSAASLTLQPRGKEVVQLLLTRAGNELVSELEEHAFEVTAWPVLASKARKSIADTWRQTPPEFGLSLRHSAQQTLRQGSYQVTLENREPVDLALVLQASDSASALTFRFGSRQLIIPANGRASTELNVQPQRPLAGTEPVTHVFKVRGDLTAAPGVNRFSEGQWTQRLPNFSLSIRVDEGQGVARGLFVVEIVNDEAVDLIVDLKAAEMGQPPKCNFRLAASQVTAPAKQKRKVQLLVERADHTLTDAPRTHAFIVTARAGDAPRLQRQITEKWQQIPPTFDIRILGQTSLERRQGEYLIDLRNTTPIELPIALEAADRNRECAFRLSEKQIRLAPGQTQQVRLTVQGRQDMLGLQGRTHQFQIDAQLTNVLGVRRQATASWVQVPAALSVQLTPGRRRGGNKAEFQLMAKNESSVPLTMEASANDPNGSLRFQFSPPRINVPPAEERPMKMRANAIARIPRGEEAKLHPITVAVTAAEAPMFVERLHGEWEEMPRGRFSCGCVLAIAIAILFLAAAFAAFLSAAGYY